MSSKTFFDILNEINSLTMMADFGDKSFIEQVTSLFKELKSLFDLSENNEVKAAVGGIFIALEDIINRLPDLNEKGFGSAIEELNIYLKKIDIFADELVFTEETEKKQTEQHETDTPEWADDDLLSEFFTNQIDNLNKIEELLLKIEKGDLRLVAPVKRAIHTIKGEAGVLGFFDIEQLCHKLEDFIEEHADNLSDFTQPIYMSKDWLVSALQAHSKGEEPEENFDYLLDAFEGKDNITPVSDKSAPKTALKSESKSVSAPEAKPAPAPEAKPAPAPEAKPAPAPEAKPAPAPAPGVPEKLFFEPYNPEWDSETVDLIIDFLQESESALANVDDILLNIEKGDLTDDEINQLFRAFHTMKGVAGFLELSEIEKLAHNTETVLNRARKHELLLKCEALDVIFDSTGVMREMLDAIRNVLEKRDLLYPNRKFPELLKRLTDVIAGPEEQCDKKKPASGVETESSPAPVSESVAQPAPEPVAQPAPEPVAQPAPKKQSKIKTVEQIAEKAIKTTGHISKIKETVKVDLERVDKLVEMIGELVIVESMVVNAPEIEAIASQKVRNYINQLNKITRDLQDVGMMMRMVPVKSVFQKMARMVRDLSRKSGKKIKFMQSGETTEVDRNIVEHLNDPLVHMIRNAVDHGIETVEERVAAGKPPEGIIKLSAYHEGGKIIIEIRDDGKGLDKQAIRAKAIKQNIISEKDNLSDNDLYNLIFAPGFSTAKKVTQISGRGVGMDVVKRNIEQLRGVVMIESEQGKGTVFKIVLPLTLAIIDGMLLRCGPERFLIPTLSIIESLKPQPEMISRFANKREFINVRGEILPLIRLDRVFEIDGAKQDPLDALVMVVETYGSKIGLLVDDILKQQQVVIKSVGGILKNQPLFAGAAILSDGSVGLIINVEEIISKSKDSYNYKV